MARLFDDASTEYLVASSAPPPVGPDVSDRNRFSMSCWVKSDDATINQSLLWVGESGSPNRFTTLQLLGVTAGDPCRVLKNTYGAGSVESAITANGYTANRWHHVCGVVTRVDLMNCYLDGDIGNKGTNTNSKSVVGHNSTAIGAARDSTPGAYTSGSIADVAFFDYALSEEQVVSLSLGMCARFFDPVMYPPLIEDQDLDIVGGVQFTRGGTPTVSDHPPLIFLEPIHYSFPAPAPSFIPYPRPRGTRGGMLELVGGMH